MTFDNIVGYFRKEFPELTLTSTPADDIFDAEILFTNTPFSIAVYNGKCGVSVKCKKNGGTYFKHPLANAQPIEAAAYIREQLSA